MADVHIKLTEQASEKSDQRMIGFEYDQEGDIFEIRFSDNTIDHSEFIEESGIVIDYNSENKIVSIEVTSFSRRVGKQTTIKNIAV